MQTCLPRSYLKPVRDEEAESQRKAKSRQARQRRRLTQGVTLSELKEAKRVIDPSQLEKQTQTGGLRSSTEGQCGQRTFSQETTELLCSHTVLQQTEHLQTRSHRTFDEEDNWRKTVEDKNDRSTYSVISLSASGACGFTPCLMNCTSPSGIKWKDENENTVYASSRVKIQDHQWISDDSFVGMGAESSTA
ncbi:uncharacterized protein LOC143485279 [Brachyhypopomus gauderio]|uniref:uncharacterized protein LOC143485279 n=1 Tax=Brachyhypopomus gauderio TaxID=698409 RepID=UPI004042439E